MNHSQYNNRHPLLDIFGKTLCLLGVALYHVIILLLDLIHFVFSLIEHDDSPSTSDIGAHYDIRSGDFDSVQQYDGIYMKRPDQESHD